MEFSGESFTPSFVVEIDNVGSERGPKFTDLDNKFKNVYFDHHTSVHIHSIWMDNRSENHNICVYKQKNNSTIGHHKREGMV